MLIYVLQNQDGTVDFSNKPISSGKVKSRLYEVDDSDYNDVKQGTKTFYIDEFGYIRTKESNRHAEVLALRLEAKQKKADLLDKLQKKKATLDDIQEALTQIL